ncbi:GTP 3',8-cyclase MoaA [Sandarakinorhabdus sp. AAP62]|uniref:GTP 3',8-cyclase MoaA n=1 Tax=Sandarakinorhabdus sp. AAP62 TaxID=1248916 RepID=UPI000476EF1F|nr:GTP 3',8-cyclase MoaA [Sandarakinorhabdus sp. AAP62]
MFGDGNNVASVPAAATTATAARALVDPFGRAITYLRVSVTDRCDFRCVYCMAEDMTFLPKNEVLSLEEIDLLASAFIRRGTRKLRLTGGEPLVRRGIIDLVSSLGRHLKTGALEELTLTSNGSQMVRHAEALFAAGVRRVNISLDTLDAEKFARITRWGRLPQVLDGIAAAKAAGLQVKLNTVALAHENAGEIETLMQFAAAGGHDLTLIETMPLGEIGEDRVDQYLPLSRVRRDLAQRYTLTDLPHRTGGPARYSYVQELGLQLGFITPLTHNFCESCNRVRLTATGQLFMCLGQDDQADLRSVIRRLGTNGAGNDEAAIDAALDEAISRKPKGHDFVIERRGARPAVARHMSLTGG